MTITRSSAHSPTFPSLQPMSQLFLEPFCCFTYITAHSPTLPLLHLHHSSFSNPSFASPTSQALHLLLILQPFRHFTYVRTHSPTLPSVYLHHSSLANLPLLHLGDNSFSYPSSASPASQALNLIHLASRPWFRC